MDKIWAEVDASHFKLSAEGAMRNTDKKYAENLSLNHTDNDWKTFYQAVQALENGCGYTANEHVVALCRTCAEQDNLRLLQIIEKKSTMFDTVMFLHCVDHTVKLEWLNTNAFSSISSLFECIRQELVTGAPSEVALPSVVNGLCQLADLSPERFQYLLNHYLLYRTNNVPLMTVLLSHLSDNGWVALSNCISFSDTEQHRIKFWDSCGKALNWAVIHRRAYPLLDAWDAYIKHSMTIGKFGESLYNSVSNYLITIMYYQLDSVYAYKNAFEKAVSAGVNAMRCWYERSLQQRGALFACLAQIEHLRFIWINRQEDYAVPFPEELRCQALQLILQYRFFWDNPLLKEKAQREVWQLKEWLDTKNVNNE